MNKWLFAGSALFLFAISFAASFLERFGPFAEKGVYAAAAKSGPRILSAAKELYQAFDAEERASCVFPLGSKEHANWHFIPRPRKGIALRKMSETQREKTTALVLAGLGQLGFKKSEEVRVLEEVLHEIETPNPNRSFVRDPLLYYISFFNKPTADGPWGWRYEGHHLSINFLLEGDKVISHTPGFFGANPSVVKTGKRKGMQVLKKVEELARQLVTSLDEKLQKACLGEEVPKEVPSTQKARYDGPLPKGVSGASLSAAQKETLRKLIEAYVEKSPADLTEAVWEKLKGAGGLDKVHVAWRGSLKSERPHSYLVHGPSFVINYSNVQGGGTHVHSSFRLLGGDFGK